MMKFSTHNEEWYDDETGESYKYVITSRVTPATRWEPEDQEIILEAYYIDDIPVNKVDFLQITQLNEGDLFDGPQQYSDYLPEDFDEDDGWR